MADQMRGPSILVRSMSEAPDVVYKYGNRWQYHSQSDRHSKLACWGILFDLLRACPILSEHAARRSVAFGINHEMRGFKTNKKKDLDLVICTPRGAPEEDARSVRDLVDQWGVVLTPKERVELDALPDLVEAPVGMVHVALEAKANMTEHIKALPRFFDELNSSHQMVHGASDMAIAVGFAMINIADSFISPGRNKFTISASSLAEVTMHRQPHAVLRTIERFKELPKRTKTGEEGFDALAIVLVDCKNDGSPVTLVEKPPAPGPDDVFEYGAMIRRVAHLYEARFPHV